MEVLEVGAPLPITGPGIDHTANIHLRWGYREERPGGRDGQQTESSQENKIIFQIYSPGHSKNFKYLIRVGEPVKGYIATHNKLLLSCIFASSGE